MNMPRRGEHRPGSDGLIAGAVGLTGAPAGRLRSAFEDYRFNPITARELPSLSCGVSLLTTFEPAAEPLDWELGTHGIYVQLPNPLLYPNPPPAPPLPRGEAYASLRSLPKYDVDPPARNPQRLPLLINATYLPDVAPQQGWTKREAVESAIRKAGWNGEIGEALWGSLRVTRYQSRKAEAEYDEWRERRGE